MRGIDVVTVADFQGHAAERSELRALLFLAAWMRHAGESRAWPVHVVCIGDPPRRVRRFADRVGARVTVHAPLLFNTLRTSNKLRGFEVSMETDRVLLLDTDVLVLQDLVPLCGVVEDGVGIGVATVNYLPEETWRHVYRAADVPYPGPTGTCWCADPLLANHRGLRQDERDLCLRAPPFFNSGVVIAPRRLGFGARWGDHLRRIAQYFREHPHLWPPARPVPTDEEGLATAVEQCRCEGVAIVSVPWSYHTRPLLLRAGAIRWEEIALFHYHNALNPYVRSLDDLPAFLSGGIETRVPPGDRVAFRELYAFLAELHASALAYS